MWSDNIIKVQHLVMSALFSNPFNTITTVIETMTMGIRYTWPAWDRALFITVNNNQISFIMCQMTFNVIIRFSENCIGLCVSIFCTILSGFSKGILIVLLTLWRLRDGICAYVCACLTYQWHIHATISAIPIEKHNACLKQEKKLQIVITVTGNVLCQCSKWCNVHLL